MRLVPLHATSCRLWMCSFATCICISSSSTTRDRTRAVVACAGYLSSSAPIQHVKLPAGGVGRKRVTHPVGCALFLRPLPEPDVPVSRHPALQCFAFVMGLPRAQASFATFTNNCQNRFGFTHHAHLPLLTIENTCFPSPRQPALARGRLSRPPTTMEAPSPWGSRPVGDPTFTLSGRLSAG